MNKLAICAGALALSMWATTLTAEVVFESATTGSVGQTSGAGLTVSDAAFTGTNFQVTSTVTIRSIGAHLSDFAQGQPIFGAIVRLTGQFDFPNSTDLSTDDLLGATLIYPPDPSDNAVGHLRLTLTPGWYAVLFGSGRFGATGDAGAWLNNNHNGTSQTYTILQSTGQVVFQAPGARFFVDSDPLPAFRRVARSGSTLIPGTQIAFTSFSIPAWSDGYCAFRASGPTDSGNHQSGVYRWNDGALELVANRGTSIPQGVGAFTSFSLYSQTSQGIVAFQGGGSSSQSGIYRWSSETLTRLADRNTPIPGGIGNFNNLSFYVAMEGENIAFTGYPPAPAPGGVYLHDGTQLNIIADSNTPQPGTDENFATFIIQPMSVDRGDVVFRAAGVLEGGTLGLYRRSTSSEIERIVDSNEMVPGGSLPMGYVGNGNARRGNVALAGSDDFPTVTEASLFTITGPQRQIDVIATLNTPVPGGVGSYKQLFDPSYDGKNILFYGVDQADRRALFSNITGELSEVVGQGDTIEGRTIITSNLTSINIGSQAIDRYAMALRCSFTDTSSGIYLAMYPPTPGDFDRDTDTDLADVSAWMNCHAGSLAEIGEECRPADTNGDLDVDFTDAANALLCLAGPDNGSACSP